MPNHDPDDTSYIDEVLGKIEAKGRHPAAPGLRIPISTIKTDPSVLVPGFYIQRTIQHFYDSATGPGYWTKNRKWYWCGFRTWWRWHKVNNEQRRQERAEAERRWLEGGPE